MVKMAEYLASIVQFFTIISFQPSSLNIFENGNFIWKFHIL